MLIIFVIVGSSVGKISSKNPAGIGSKAHDFFRTFANNLKHLLFSCLSKSVQRNIRRFNVRDTCETYISAAIRIKFLSDLRFFCDEKLIENIM